MSYRKILRSTLTVLGAILIGAIGAGVWEHLLHPLLISSRDVILNIASLGMTKFKDATYIEIAKGFHESAGQDLRLKFATFFIVLVFLSTLYLVFQTRETRRSYSELLGRLENQKKGVKPDGRSLDELYKEASSLNSGIKSLSRYVYVTVILGLMTITITFVSAISSEYINSAITHYNQMLNISGPYLDAAREKQIISSFAQTKNRDDYEHVINELRAVAEKNHLRVPEFKIW